MRIYYIDKNVSLLMAVLVAFNKQEVHYQAILYSQLKQ